MTISLTPHLCCADAARAIAFYVAAFGAHEDYRLAAPDGKIGHAELRIGDALISLADEYPEYGVRSPRAYGGSPVSLKLQVPDVDAFVARAVAAGAAVVRPPADQFYGERSARIEDPFGHTWQVSTTIEQISLADMQSRFAALFKT
jgi:PhnB protein